jgi:acyl-CoA thioesterase YciA
VTVAFDQVEFKSPVFVGDLVSLYCTTSRLGRTSIEVQVSVWAQRASDRDQFMHVTEGKVTFVAVDDEGRPTPILRREPP